MNKYLLRNIIIIIISVTIVSIWYWYSSLPQPPEAKVDFSIKEVTIEKTLEAEYNKTTVHTNSSENAHFVIVNISIENEEKWLEIVPPFYLFDRDGDEYRDQIRLLTNETRWIDIINLTMINEEERRGSMEDSIPPDPNSIVYRKILFEFPIDEELDELVFFYGFRDNEFTSVKKLYRASLDLT